MVGRSLKTGMTTEIFIFVVAAYRTMSTTPLKISPTPAHFPSVIGSPRYLAASRTPHM